jgi:hypothetical protein
MVKWYRQGKTDFDGGESALLPPTKLEYHTLSAVRNWVLIIFAAIHLIWMDFPPSGTWESASLCCIIWSIIFGCASPGAQLPLLPEWALISGLSMETYTKIKRFFEDEPNSDTLYWLSALRSQFIHQSNHLDFIAVHALLKFSYAQLRSRSPNTQLFCGCGEISSVHEYFVGNCPCKG